jgi:hypothetical protein
LINKFTPTLSLPITRVAHQPFINFYSTSISYGNSIYNLKDVNPDHQVKSYEIKPLESFKFGINLGKFVSGRIYMLSGLNYFIQNDKLTTQELTTKVDIIKNQVIEQYINSEGIKQETIGDKKITQTIDKTSIRYNKSTNVNVTIGLGKIWNLGHGNLSTEFMFGKSLHSKYKGSIYADKFQKNILQVNSTSLSKHMSAAYNLPVARMVDLRLGYTYSHQSLIFENLYTRNLNNHAIEIGIRKYLK